MKLTEPRLPVSYVTSADSFDQLLHDLTDQEIIGLDAERASGFRYSQRAYLIQIATDSRVYLFDPISKDLPEGWEQKFAKAMAGVAWILHSATQDLPCLAEIGVYPTSVIDTELAARFLGVERFGLASIVEQFLGFELAKEHSAADWSVRPLPAAMLSYAALDVDVLLELWTAIKVQLSSDQMKWLSQEFDRLQTFKPKPQAQQPWRNLPGMTKVRETSRQQIALALWTARDKMARELDVAPGRLIPDRSIAAVVANPPTSKRDLAGNKAFSGRASRSKLDTWWRAIEQAPSLSIEPQSKDADHLPNHRSWEQRFPDAHLRLKHARAAIADLALDLGIAPELVLTPDYLRRACFYKEPDLRVQLLGLGAREWQVEISAPVIERAFEQAESSASDQ